MRAQGMVGEKRSQSNYHIPTAASAVGNAARSFIAFAKAIPLIAPTAV
jgi:hypothetical protein